MKTYPAIALIELNNIAAGIKVGDAMAKKAPIAIISSGTVSHGKFLVLIGGSVASVDEAYQEGLRVSGSDAIDSLMLPDVHPRVLTAIGGEVQKVSSEALGIFETPSIATTIEAADGSIKGAEVTILKLRLGDGYGGKGFTLFNGRVEDVQAALDIACKVAEKKSVAARVSIIPRLHDSVVEQVNDSLRFDSAPITYFKDGEKDVTG